MVTLQLSGQILPAVCSFVAVIGITTAVTMFHIFVWSDSPADCSHLHCHTYNTTLVMKSHTYVQSDIPHCCHAAFITTSIMSYENFILFFWSDTPADCGDRVLIILVNLFLSICLCV